MNYLHRLRMKNLENYPIKFTNFRDKGYVSTEYFCDYIEETKKLVDDHQWKQQLQWLVNQ